MAKIKDDKQYKAMLERIDTIFFETDENTPSGDIRLQELDVLSALVEEYEQEHYPIKTPDLPKVMASRIAQAEISQKQAAIMLDMTSSRLNSILNGKVKPTYDQARKISARLNIDPAIVLGLERKRK